MTVDQAAILFLFGCVIWLWVQTKAAFSIVRQDLAKFATAFDNSLSNIETDMDYVLSHHPPRPGTNPEDTYDGGTE